MRYLPRLNPPDHLLGAIQARIEIAKMRTARLHLALSSTIAAAAFAALIPAVQFVYTEYAASSFGTYLSLIFSSISVAFSGGNPAV